MMGKIANAGLGGIFTGFCIFIASEAVRPEPAAAFCNKYQDSQGTIHRHCDYGYKSTHERLFYNGTETYMTCNKVMLTHTDCTLYTNGQLANQCRFYKGLFAYKGTECLY